MPTSAPKRLCGTCNREQVPGCFLLGGVDLGQCQQCARKSHCIASAGFKYRLRPTKVQDTELFRIAGACAWMYNALVRQLDWALCTYDAERRRVWRATRASLYPEVEGRLSEAQFKEVKSACPEVPFPEDFKERLLYPQSKAYDFVKAMRADPDFWARDVSASVLRDACLDFWTALGNWAAGRARRPCKQRPGGFLLVSQESAARTRVQREGVLLSRGNVVKWVRHRPWRGVPRSVTISRNAAGHWYASVLCSWVKTPTSHRSDTVVGIDPGMAVALTASDGTVLPSTRSYCVPLAKKKEAKLAKKMGRIARARQRAGLSTDGKAMARDGVWRSKRLRRTLHQAAKLDVQQANRRGDAQWKFAQDVASRHILVVFEGSKVKNLSARKVGAGAQGRGFNKHLLGEAWHAASVKLASKCAAYGGHFMTIPAAYTSQRCSACGEVNKESRLDQARYVCTSCGHAENADLNAAKNIRAVGCAYVLAGVEPVNSDVKAAVARAEIPEWARALVPVYAREHAKKQAKKPARSRPKKKAQ